MLNVKQLTIVTTQVKCLATKFFPWQLFFILTDKFSLRRHDCQIELIGTDVPCYLVETVIQ